MRKHKRILALVLMLCMVFTMFTGCKKDDSTFFSITKEAAAFESYTYVGNGEITMYGETVNFEVSGKVNGGDWTLGLKLWTADEEIELAEALVYVDDSLYVNLDGILDTVSSYVVGVNFRSVLADIYGIPVGWYEIPMPKGYLALNSDTYKEYNELGLELLEELLKGIEIKKEKSNFVIELNSTEQLSIIIDNMATYFENNEQKVMDSITGAQFEKMGDAVCEMLDTYGNAIINVVERLNEEKSLGYSGQEFEEARASVQEEIVSFKEEMKEIYNEEMQAEFHEAFAEGIAQMRQTAADIKEYDMGENTVSLKISNSMTGKEGKKEYTVKVEGEAVSSEESVSGVAEFTMKQENVSISVPENAYALEDWLYNVLSALYDISGM